MRLNPFKRLPSLNERDAFNHTVCLQQNLLSRIHTTCFQLMFYLYFISLMLLHVAWLFSSFPFQLYQHDHWSLHYVSVSFVKWCFDPVWPC